MVWNVSYLLAFPLLFLPLKTKCSCVCGVGQGWQGLGSEWLGGGWGHAVPQIGFVVSAGICVCVCVCVCVPALHLLLISVTGDTTCISCNTVGAWRFLYRLGPPYLQTLIFFNPLLIHYAFESFAWKSVLLWSATLLMMYFLQNEQHWDTVYLLKGDTRHYRSYQ